MGKSPLTRREIIEKEALRLFAERGYSEVSVRDIAQVCNIGESALYRHMKSKEELAIRVFREAYLSFAEKMLHSAKPDASFEEKLSQYLRIVLEGFDQDPILLRFLLIQQHDILAQAITRDDITPLTILRAAIVEGSDQKLFPSIDPDITTAMIMGAALQPLTFMMYGRIETTAISQHSTILQALIRLIGLGQPI